MARPKNTPEHARKPIMVRVPLDMADYIAKSAIRNGSSQCSEVARIVREKMDREAAARQAS